MRLSVSLPLEGQLPFTPTAQRTAALGFKGLCFQYEEAWTNTDCRLIREAFEEEGVAIVHLSCGESNLIHPNETVRRRSMLKIRSAMKASKILGCNTVSAMAGTRHPEALGGKWPRAWLAHPENFSKETWDLLVQVLTETLKEVEKEGVWFGLEPVSLTPINSVERLSEILRDVDSDVLKVTLDPVNLVTSVEDHFQNTDLVNKMFDMLGKNIVVAHAKDTAIRQELTLHLDEVATGNGNLDYSTLLRRLDELSPEIPLIIEHIKSDEEILSAKAYVEQIAKQVGARFV